MRYFMLVGNDGEMLIREPVESDSMSVLEFLIQGSMIAVILNINPDLCTYGESQTRSPDVMARHVIKVHTTQDGWYIPQDKSEWYTIWQPKSEELK